jgi:hypothetical protein
MSNADERAVLQQTFRNFQWSILYVAHLKGHVSHTSADMMPHLADWPTMFQSYFRLSVHGLKIHSVSEDGPTRYQLFIIVLGYKYRKCILHSKSDLRNKKWWSLPSMLSWMMADDSLESCFLQVRHTRVSTALGSARQTLFLRFCDIGCTSL